MSGTSEWNVHSTWFPPLSQNVPRDGGVCELSSKKPRGAFLIEHVTMRRIIR